MTVGPLEEVYGSATKKKVTLTWTPTSGQTGTHTLGFNAVDSAG